MLRGISPYAQEWSARWQEQVFARLTEAASWLSLKDQTPNTEDMSFVLFTDPQ